MERLTKPICTAELNAVLDKLPKAIVEEVKDTRQAYLDDKERFKQGRITIEERQKWRDEDDCPDWYEADPEREAYGISGWSADPWDDLGRDLNDRYYLTFE